MFKEYNHLLKQPYLEGFEALPAAVSRPSVFGKQKRNESCPERYRKFLKQSQAFDQENTLQTLLSGILPRREANRVSRKLLLKFKDIANVLRASPESLLNIEKMTPRAVAHLQAVSAAIELSLLQDMQQTEDLSSSERIERYLKALIGREKREIFLIILLDTHSQLINSIEMGKGTFDFVPVHTREVVSAVLEANAKYVVLAHNHPSGKVEASLDDLTITRRLSEALSFIDVSVVDHYIVGRGNIFSVYDEDSLDRSFFRC